MQVAAQGGAPSATPTRTPLGGSRAVDDFERASLGPNWVQFDSEGGHDVDWGSVTVTGHAARGPALGDGAAYYTPFVPTAASAYACIKSAGNDVSQNACACLGLDNALNDGICCCFKHEGQPPTEFEMFGWDGNVPSLGFVTAEIGTLNYAVGDYIGITRSAATFRCAMARAATPMTWVAVGSPHTLPTITGAFAGVYFYNNAFLAEQFEVGSGSALPTTHVCGARCGDGHRDPGEACDDGNALNGDCCTATCQFEPSNSSCNDANSCTVGERCNGAGVCGGFSSCRIDTTCNICGSQCTLQGAACTCG